MSNLPMLSRISRLGLSSVQREKLGIAPVANKLVEAKHKLRRMAQFRATLDVLISSGFDFWILKGMELSQRNYGDPMARYFGDLDVLLPSKEKIGELRQFLLSAGWEEIDKNAWIEDLPRRDWYMDLLHHFTMKDPVQNIHVELHWQLDFRFLKLPENELKTLLKRETEEIEVFGRKVKVLKSELEFVFLLAHATRHAWSCFKWLVDLHHFPHPQVDQEKLEYLIAYFRMEKAFFLFRSLEEKYLGWGKSSSFKSGSFLVNYASRRMEYEDMHLSTSINNKFNYFLFNIFFVRSIQDFLSVVKFFFIGSGDIYTIKLPFLYLYYFYRPVGIIRRKLLGKKS